MPDRRDTHGPSVDGEGIRIRVYAPLAKRVQYYTSGRKFPMEPVDNGFWTIDMDYGHTGEIYGFILDGSGPFPDPAGRFMPNGINGLSELPGRSMYTWGLEDWKGLPLSDYIIEELHVGAFTEEGTYSGAERRLDFLEKQGVTGVEIMPVAEFYGTRNWGYDGVYLYSPHHTYGRPEDLKRLVDSIHAHGMCAILDVVYNHSGPVGNHLDKIAPYHNSGHGNQWGRCFNLDGAYSGAIREFIIQNAIYWLEEFRFDALRLDAVHGILDHSPRHILEEMALRVRALASETGRRILLIAESDQNNNRLAKPLDECGTGISAQWDDDFHHTLHTYLTGERDGYYMDYGEIGQIEKVLNNGFLYQGEYSGYLRRKRGTVWDNPPENLVVFSQNHDQVGNRAHGERLIILAGDRKAMTAAFITLLSPYTPLIFMGEQIGAKSPFLFFIQSSDGKFASDVYDGRMREFSRFGWGKDTPDPNSQETFERSVIDWRSADSSTGRAFQEFYRELIRIRKTFLAAKRNDFNAVIGDDRVLRMRYGREVLLVSSLRDEEIPFDPGDGSWSVEFSSEWREFGGNLQRDRRVEKARILGAYSSMVLVSTGAPFP